VGENRYFAALAHLGSREIERITRQEGLDERPALPIIRLRPQAIETFIVQNPNVRRPSFSDEVHIFVM
jgi:hypothetical protein